MSNLSVYMETFGSGFKNLPSQQQEEEGEKENEWKW